MFESNTSSSSHVKNSSINSNRISSPGVLFIILILAIIFFISALLHLLIRFLIKRNSSSSSYSSNPQNLETNGSSTNSDAIQRQLQQLFHLHDSGLDQAFIDALPVFLYREMVVVGSKEPFDCAVCLCEFSHDDNLRLLPLCGHAFHINCIDTWLLSNSTCPLCRGALFFPPVTLHNSDDDDDDNMRMVPVRLGKFRSTSDRNHNSAACQIDGDGDGNGNGNASIIRREEGESSSSNLDAIARRCYSMGSFQYVVGDADLRLTLSIREPNGTRTREFKEEEGKRSKGESFSVSKIWLWRNNNKTDKFRVSQRHHASSFDAGLPWMARS